MMTHNIVMAGLVPAIHVFLAHQSKTWMPAPSAGMTVERLCRSSLAFMILRATLIALLTAIIRIDQVAERLVVIRHVLHELRAGVLVQVQTDLIHFPRLQK